MIWEVCFKIHIFFTLCSIRVPSTVRQPTNRCIIQSNVRHTFRQLTNRCIFKSNVHHTFRQLTNRCIFKSNVHHTFRQTTNAVVTQHTQCASQKFIPINERIAQWQSGRLQIGRSPVRTRMRSFLFRDHISHPTHRSPPPPSPAASSPAPSRRLGQTHPSTTETRPRAASRTPAPWPRTR